MDQNQLGLLITLISAGSALLIAIFVILYIFVFSKNRIKKQIREIQRRYSYLDALLIGQDSQYIHRIEIVSRTNLLYVEKHEYFTRKFKDIYENDDKFVDSLIKQLNLLVANGQYKNIKSTINETKKALEAFEKQVNALDKELYSLIKLEEESRQMILRHKEKYRQIKQIYFNNLSSIEMISNSMNQVFEKLEKLFAEYDAHVEGAEYDDANNLLPTIVKVLDAVEQVLHVIPDLCVLVNDVLPRKIEEISEEYEKYASLGIPLQHLMFKNKLANWNKKTKQLKSQLSALHTKMVKEEAAEIQNEISEIHNAINVELHDKDEFESRLKDIYHDSVELENSFVRICSIIPQIKSIYLINEERMNGVEELRKHVNALTTARYGLDNYIHSALKQPFSVLNDKLNSVFDEYTIAKAGVVEFKAFIDSLKTYTEEAYNLIFVYYYRCKQIELALRNINIDTISEEYRSQIAACYDYINDIDQALKVRPIDVEDVNAKVEQLKSYANLLFEQIEEKSRLSQLAESAFVYANRDRQAQSDVNEELIKLENSFFQGDFQKVYQGANSLFRYNHIEESNAN